MQLCPSLPTPWKCDSSLPWPWAGKQGLWVSSGSTPPRYVTLAVSVPLQASVSLFKFRGGLVQVARGGSGEGLGLGGQAAKEVSATAPSAGHSLPAPAPASLPPQGGHVRCPRGHHKRQTVAGRGAELSHLARRPPGRLRAASSPSFPFAEGSQGWLGLSKRPGFPEGQLGPGAGSHSGRLGGLGLGEFSGWGPTPDDRLCPPNTPLPGRPRAL